MNDLGVCFRIELVSDDIVGGEEELHALFFCELEHFRSMSLG